MISGVNFSKHAFFNSLLARDGLQGRTLGSPW